MVIFHKPVRNVRVRSYGAAHMAGTSQPFLGF